MKASVMLTAEEARTISEYRAWRDDVLTHLVAGLHHYMDAEQAAEVAQRCFDLMEDRRTVRDMKLRQKIGG